MSIIKTIAQVTAGVAIILGAAYVGGKIGQTVLKKDWLKAFGVVA